MRMWLVSSWFAVALIASCGGDDGGAVDPAAIDVLVLSMGNPIAGRDVTVISSDGMVQTVKTSASGHAIVTLGPNATQATVYSDSTSTEGRYTMQGVVPGDHICLGCTFVTTACATTSLPQIFSIRRDGTGWSWNLSAGDPYAGIEISWAPMANNPNGRGHLLSPPGAMQASTSSSADITIKVLARADVASYDELRTLSRDDWSSIPFCAIGAHN